MAGLLDSVLPAIFSAGNKAQRVVKGLLADPVGTLQQNVDTVMPTGYERQQWWQQMTGNLGNTVAADAARQKMDELAQNAALNAITVYHGSPHSFDRFETSKHIGTGDGTQMQGIGTYLAESPEVAKVYARDKNFYKVDLPDESLGKMLSLDDPIMTQRHLGNELNAIHINNPEIKDKFFEFAKKNAKGQDFFDIVLENYAKKLKYSDFKGDVFTEANRLATEDFKKAGLTGFKYLDKGSRGAGTGTANFVVFDDQLPTILERNGQPIRGLLK